MSGSAFADARTGVRSLATHQLEEGNEKGNGMRRAEPLRWKAREDRWIYKTTVAGPVVETTVKTILTSKGAGLRKRNGSVYRINLQS